MRKSVGAVAVVAALLGVVLVVVPPVGASPPVIPPGVEPRCGASASDVNYAACVTVVNATRGFQSPGVANNLWGLQFNASFGVLGRSAGRRDAHALNGTAAVSGLEPGLGWVAYRCTVAWPNTHGCGIEMTTRAEWVQVPVIGNVALLAEVRRRDPNAAVTSRGQVFYRSAETQSCASASRYVACRHTGNQGPQRWTRFNFELTNETVMVNVTNFLPHRLVLANKQWGQAIVDERGVTRDTRLANGEMNSARSIAPYNDALAAAPVGQWGGLRPLSAENTHIHLNYRITGPGQYTNQLVGVDLQFENVGEDDRPRWRPVEDPARACRITGPGAHPRCRVGVASVGGNTQLDISLENFN